MENRFHFSFIFEKGLILKWAALWGFDGSYGSCVGTNSRFRANSLGTPLSSFRWTIPSRYRPRRPGPKPVNFTSSRHKTSNTSALTVPKSMAPHEDCRFFDLPRHVRDHIYRNVLVVAHPLYLFKDPRSPKVELFAPQKRREWLALLFTN